MEGQLAWHSIMPTAGTWVCKLTWRRKLSLIKDEARHQHRSTAMDTLSVLVCFHFHYKLPMNRNIIIDSWVITENLNNFEDIPGTVTED